MKDFLRRAQLRFPHRVQSHDVNLFSVLCIMESYHLANAHDGTYHTWSPHSKETLTKPLWNRARAQVMESLEYNVCAGGVSLEYILNYVGAAYKPEELKKTAVMVEEGGVKRIKRYTDKEYQYEFVVQPSFRKRIQTTKPYAMGQHMALYPGETLQNPKESVHVPARNMIFTYLKDGVCRGFMLAVYSDRDTYDTVEGNDYDALYEGIYIDVICATGTRGAGKQMIQLLRSLYTCNITLKATPNAMSYYPTLDPPFSFGTCNKKADQALNDDLVRLMKEDVHKGSPYKKHDNYEGLSPQRKEIVKLIFKHNLAHDQNSSEMLWADTLTKSGKTKKAPCPYTIEGDISDKEAAHMYKNDCLKNGTKMSTCIRTRKRSPQKSSSPKPKSAKSRLTKQYNTIRANYVKLVRKHFHNQMSYADIKDVVGNSDEHAMAVWNVFHDTPPA